MFEDYIQPLADFARLHQVWAAPIVFALAFMESLAFISLLVPAWGALVLIGTLIAAGDLKAALDAYTAQSGAQLLYKAEDVKGRGEWCVVRRDRRSGKVLDFTLSEGTSLKAGAQVLVDR